MKALIVLRCLTGVLMLLIIATFANRLLDELGYMRTSYFWLVLTMITFCMWGGLAIFIAGNDDDLL